MQMSVRISGISAINSDTQVRIERTTEAQQKESIRLNGELSPFNLVKWPQIIHCGSNHVS